jgi:hypothetical protein
VIRRWKAQVTSSRPPRAREGRPQEGFDLVEHTPRLRSSPATRRVFGGAEGIDQVPRASNSSGEDRGAVTGAAR